MSLELFVALQNLANAYNLWRESILVQDERRRAFDALFDANAPADEISNARYEVKSVDNVTAQHMADLVKAIKNVVDLVNNELPKGK
jgi:hypothetical protein